jgi:hypothetical protein
LKFAKISLPLQGTPKLINMRQITVLTKAACLPVAVALLLLTPWGCERYDFERVHVPLHFSADTVSFDTIFTPIGSTTFACKVYNRSDRQLLIDEVRLHKGGGSPFAMNVDGRTGASVRGIRLARRDSLFIFLEVKKNEALLLTDHIVFVTGGAEQRGVELVAYGQAVVLIDRDTTLRGNHAFTSEKPYLITGSLTVDSGATLTVEGGAKLYFGKGCGITVSGTLNANGLPSSPCLFSHPRYKDAWYGTAGGQWQGITVSGSGKAALAHAQLRGARQGFTVLDTLGEAAAPQLRLARSKIEYAEGGMSLCGGSAVADNCRVVHSLTSAVQVQGGSCEAYHCTFAAYDLEAHQRHGAQVALQNFRVRSKRDTVDAPLRRAYFGNSIIYGSNASELTIRQRPGAAMEYRLESCAVKGKPNQNGFIGVITGDPKFRDVGKGDFRLSEGSPAINAGKPEVANSFPKDLEGFDRSAEQDTSMGCHAYRRQQ